MINSRSKPILNSPPRPQRSVKLVENCKGMGVVNEVTLRSMESSATVKEEPPVQVDELLDRHMNIQGGMSADMYFRIVAERDRQLLSGITHIGKSVETDENVQPRSDATVKKISTERFFQPKISTTVNQFTSNNKFSIQPQTVTPLRQLLPIEQSVQPKIGTTADLPSATDWRAETVNQFTPNDQTDTPVSQFMPVQPLVYLESEKPTVGLSQSQLSQDLSEKEIKLEPIDIPLVPYASELNPTILVPNTGNNEIPVIDLEIEGALVERSLETSLPEVVTEVSRKQRDQNEEFYHIQKQLRKACVRHSEVRQELSTVNEEMAGVIARLFHTQHSSAQTRREINKLNTEIGQLLRDINETENELREQNREFDEEKQLFEKYGEIMGGYKVKVEEADLQTLIHKELAEESKKLQELLDKKASIESGSSTCISTVVDGTCHSQLRQEIEHLKTEKQQLDTQIQAMEGKVQTETARQSQLKQETEVLHKRNTAQLLCLKRQLKEIQTRNKQWNEQATELQQSIADIQGQMDG